MIVRGLLIPCAGWQNHNRKDCSHAWIHSERVWLVVYRGGWTNCSSHGSALSGRPKHLKRPSPFFAFILRMRNNMKYPIVSHHIPPIPRKSCAQTLACLWPRSTTCLGHLNSFRGSRSVPAPEFMVETSTRDVAPSKGWETSGWRSKMCTSMWYTIWNQHFINSQVCTPWLIFEAAL